MNLLVCGLKLGINYFVFMCLAFKSPKEDSNYSAMSGNAMSEMSYFPDIALVYRV